MFQKSRETSTVQADPPPSAPRDRGAPPVTTRDAVAELDQVERDLADVRERKRGLELDEARLWSRRNHLEQELIHALGGPWWREHAQAAGPAAGGSPAAPPRQAPAGDGRPPERAGFPHERTAPRGSAEQRRK